jgi:hypothetical protein
MSQQFGPLLLDLESLERMSRRELLDFIVGPGGGSMRFLDKLSKREIMELARAAHFALWETHFTCRKWFDARTEEDTLGRAPDEEVVKSYNLLVYGGASCMWQCLIGNGTGTAGQNLTFFNNANAAIGVGDSSTAAAANQTDLQASTNKTRVGMSSTYPQHTDGVTSASNTITFQSSFPASGGTAANYAWNEVAVFNSASAGVGRMLNRLAPGGGFGTKAGGVWSMSTAITLS